MKIRNKIILFFIFFCISVFLASCDYANIDNTLVSVEEFVLDGDYNSQTDTLYILSEGNIASFRNNEEKYRLGLELKYGILSCDNKDVYVLNLDNGILTSYDEKLKIKNIVNNNFETAHIIDMEVVSDKIIYLQSDIMSSAKLYITDLEGNDLDEITLPGGIINIYKKSRNSILALYTNGPDSTMYEISLETNSIVNEVSFPIVSIIDMVYDSETENYYLLNENTLYICETKNDFNIEPVAIMNNIIGEQKELLRIESIVCDNEVYLILDGRLNGFYKDIEENIVGVSIYGIEEYYAINAIEELTYVYPNYVFYFNPPSSDSGYGYQKLFVSLLSQADTYDIYYFLDAPSSEIYNDNINFDIIKKQGCMMDLSDSRELVEYVNKLFPWLKESCYYDEKLVMIPLYSTSPCMIFADESTVSPTWEDVVNIDLSLLDKDAYLALPFTLKRFENTLLGQYMIKFRDEKGHVDFTNKEFSILLELLHRSSEPNFLLENSRYDNYAQSYEIKIEDTYYVYYNPESEVEKIHQILGYREDAEYKIPVAIKYVCINPNSENKEVAIKLLEHMASEVYEDTMPLSMIFEDVEMYTSLVNSQRQKELVRQAYNYMENCTVYIDEQFISYATNELLPIYNEGAMDKEAFIKFFIEKYEMWYGEQK